MHEIDRIVFSEDAITARVKALGDRISHDYAGRDVVIISILKGAVLFTADLIRHITLPATIEFIRAASYGNATESSGDIKLEQDSIADVRGRHVLLVDTIIDSGATMSHLINYFSEKRPAAIQVVVLLDKKIRRTADVSVAYVGFEIPDMFVVGYGMDCGERYRNLPYIAAIKQAPFNSPG